MRVRRLASTLGAVALAAALAFPVAARSPRASSWLVYREVHWTPVEQQTPCAPDGTHCGDSNPDESVWVINRTDCLWDVDDYLVANFGLASVIGPGVTVTGQTCIIADSADHQTGFWIANPELIGTLTVGDYTVTVPGGHYGCIVGPIYERPAPHQQDPSLPPIPNSNGGVGLRTDITFTLTNPTSRRVRGVDARAGIAYAGFKPMATTVGLCPSWPYFSVGQRISTNPEVWAWIE